MAFVAHTGRAPSLTGFGDAISNLREILSSAGLEIVEEGVDAAGPFVGWRFAGSSADPIRARIEADEEEWLEVVDFG